MDGQTELIQALKKAGRDLLLAGFMFGVPERTLAFITNPSALELGLLVVGLVFFLSVLTQFLPSEKESP